MQLKGNVMCCTKNNSLAPYDLAPTYLADFISNHLLDIGHAGSVSILQTHWAGSHLGTFAFAVLSP